MSSHSTGQNGLLFRIVRKLSSDSYINKTVISDPGCLPDFQNHVMVELFLRASDFLGVDNILAWHGCILGNIVSEK